MKKVTVLLALMVLASFTWLQAQSRQVTGTVTSAADGMPLPGVQIVLKGATGGGITDINGKYSLNVPEAVNALIFKFVGYADLEVAIEGRTVINVALETSSIGLEEVIVMGYSTKGKNAITGSTVQIESDKIKDVPVVSVDQALQGKVAGLNISTSSGTPGSVQDIRIRGVGSYSAGNDPLIVIDGVPMVNGDMSGGGDSRGTLSALAALNNNDIASITVLKDASATSAYGARGSNGVIVITTNKGSKGKTKFNLTSYMGFQNKATQGPDVLTGAQREELLLESIYNTYGATYGFTEATAYDWASTNGAWWIDRLDPWIADGRQDNRWEEAMANKNAPTTNVTLSASGGDEISSFYASMSFNNTENIVVGSNFERYTGSLNYNRDLSKTVKFSSSNTVSNTIQNGLFLEQSAYFANPMMGKYFMSPFYAPYDADGNVNTNTGSLYSWLYLKDHDIAKNDLIRGISNNFLEWEIIKGLKFKSLVSFDLMMTDYKTYGNRPYGDSAPENDSTYSTTETNSNFVTQNSLSYDYKINDHSLNFLALIEYQENKNDYLWAYGENFATDGLTNVASAGANLDGSSSFTDWKNASYLGMVNYNFQGKYIADLTFRREGASRFAPGYRWGNFWSVGAAWNLTQEEFLASVDILDKLRLRASYGLSGNSGIALNSYQSLLQYDADYANAGAAYPSGYGNTFLTWEKNNTIDAGLDFAILDNRIDGSVSYFNKRTYDLLQAVPLSRTSGHASITQNIGEVVNKGIELMVNFDLIRSKDLNLSLSLNFATLDNEVTEMAKDGEGEYISIITGTRGIEVGHPINEWRMRTYAGVNPDNGNPIWYLDPEGDDPTATTEDYYAAAEVYQGASAIPTYSGGGAFHVDFKGVYFDMNVYFAGGHKIYEDWAFYTHHAGYYPTYLYQGDARLMDRWQEPGDVTDVPRQQFNSVGNNASRTSTRFLYDGDYLRVKDLVLGYNLPKSLVSKIKFDGASIYVRGTNLFTWVKDDRLKYDPEVRADGFTRMTNPPIKSVSIGLNLNF